MLDHILSWEAGNPNMAREIPTFCWRVSHENLLFIGDFIGFSIAMFDYWRVCSFLGGRVQGIVHNSYCVGFRWMNKSWGYSTRGSSWLKLAESSERIPGIPMSVPHVMAPGAPRRCVSWCRSWLWIVDRPVSSVPPDLGSKQDECLRCSNFEALGWFLSKLLGGSWFVFFFTGRIISWWESLSEHHLRIDEDN